MAFIRAASAANGSAEAARRVVTHGSGQGQQHDGDDDRDGAQHFPNHGASPLESIVDARAGEAVCPFGETTCDQPRGQRQVAETQRQEHQEDDDDRRAAW